MLCTLTLSIIKSLSCLSTVKMASLDDSGGKELKWSSEICNISPSSSLELFFRIFVEH